MRTRIIFYSFVELNKGDQFHWNTQLVFKSFLNLNPHLRPLNYLSPTSDDKKATSEDSLHSMYRTLNGQVTKAEEDRKSTINTRWNEFIDQCDEETRSQLERLCEVVYEIQEAEGRQDTEAKESCENEYNELFSLIARPDGTGTDFVSLFMRVKEDRIIRGQISRSGRIFIAV